MVRDNDNSSKNVIPLRKVDLRERKEEKFFKIILSVLVVVVFLFSLLFYLGSSFYQDLRTDTSKGDLDDRVVFSRKSNVEKEDSQVLDTNVELQEKFINTDSIVNFEEITANNRNVVVTENVIKLNIPRMISSNPSGFYAIIGMFSNYENALNLEKTNITKFESFIFEPDRNDLYRVGLFISEDDINNAKLLLQKIRILHEGSWLLYNLKK